MIKASIILTAAFCISWLLRKRSAAERHVVWVAALIAAAVLPLLSLLLPAWQPLWRSESWMHCRQFRP